MKTNSLYKDFFNSASEKGVYVFYEDSKLKVSDTVNVFSIKSGWCSRNVGSSGFTKNKSLTRSLLRSKGYPVVRGDIFDENESQVALKYVHSIGYPVVVKPNDLAHGVGVYTNITNDEDFLFFFNKCSGVRGGVIVEKHFDGEEYRFLLVGSKVSAVMMRRPANVLGNGVSNIRQLIKNKNILKKKIGHPLHKIDQNLIDELEKKGMSLDDIPFKDEYVQLRGVSNISAGGDRVDVTAITNQIYINFVEEISAKLFSGITFSGFDVFIKKITEPPEQGDWSICEINSRPNLNHYCVLEGEARGVAALALDMFFPDKSQKKCILNILDDDKYRGAVYVKVSGHFRDFAFPYEVKREANIRSVTGWGRKITEKGYEFVLNGSLDSVNSVVEWIRIVGKDKPSLVRVFSVNVSDYRGFLVRKEKNIFSYKNDGEFVTDNNLCDFYRCQEPVMGELVSITFSKNDENSVLNSICFMEGNIQNKIYSKGDVSLHVLIDGDNAESLKNEIFNSIAKAGVFFKIKVIEKKIN